MKYNPFSNDIWLQINKQLAIAKAESEKTKTRPVAVFDADGTLWDTDLGEAFFQFQIKHNLVPLPNDPFNFYLNLKKKNNDPRAAYLWLAQINSNISIQKVRTWAEQAVLENSPLPIFEDQYKLIQLFIHNNIDIYIVTASIKWAVEPGAKRLGLGFDSVIGVETHLDENNLITDKQKGIITYKQGKIERLLEITNGRKPFFATGNTTGDISILESASLALAVCSADSSSRLFESENELQQIALQKGWLRHKFN